MTFRVRSALTVVILISTACLLYARDNPKKDPAAAVENDIAVYFSPNGGCTDAIVRELDAAKVSIDMQAFSFTSNEIAKSLGRAAERGVRVRALCDKGATGDGYNGITYVAHHRVATFTDGEHLIAHNKVMIIDGQTIITGSFNFTKQAEVENAENLLIIKSKPKLAQAYAKNFELHLQHAKKYEAAKGEPAQKR